MKKTWENILLLTALIIGFVIHICKGQTITTCSNSLTTTITASTTVVNYIESRNYPSSYTSNGECSLVISTSTGYVIKFNFEAFTKNSNDDTFHIYDGSTSSSSDLVDIDDLQTGTSYQSSGSNINLRNTHSSNGNKIFWIAYIAVTELPPCASAYTTYTASTSQQTINSHTNYSLENYPSDYDNFWLIKKPSASDVFKFFFAIFKTEAYVDCTRFDRLVIYDGPCTTDDVEETFCGWQGSTLPYKASRTVDTSGQYLLLRFITDGSVTYQGFQMTYFTETNNATDENADEDDEEEQNLAWIAGPVVAGVVILTIFYCHIKKKIDEKRAKKTAATQPNAANDPVAIEGSNAATARDVTPTTSNGQAALSNNQVSPRNEQASRPSSAPTTPLPERKNAPPPRLPPIERPPVDPLPAIDSGYRPPPSYEASTVGVPLDLPPPYSVSVHYPLDPHGNAYPSAPPMSYSTTEENNQAWMTSTSNIYPSSGYTPSVPDVEETSFSHNSNVPPQFEYDDKSTSRA